MIVWVEDVTMFNDLQIIYEYVRVCVRMPDERASSTSPKKSFLVCQVKSRG